MDKPAPPSTRSFPVQGSKTPLNAQVWAPQVDLKSNPEAVIASWFLPRRITKVWYMTPKARPLKNDLPHIAISVDELFTAAFHKSHRIYQRESLLGWRPVTFEPTASYPHEEPPLVHPEAPRFSNSPDVKIRESAETIIIEIELPDIDEESLYLEVSGDLLIIKAERTTTVQHPSGAKKSPKASLVHRYVKLPVAARPGNIQARLDGSLLRIKISKPLANIRSKDPMER